MSRKSLALWVSVLALVGLFTSCGTSNSGDALFEEDTDIIGEAAFMDDEAGAREVSYTPGLHCAIPAGLSSIDIFKYGWKAGNVAENAAPKWVKLTSTNAVKAKILYKFQETAPGRLKTVKVYGKGSRCLIEFLNYNTNTYDSFGAHNLSNGPVTVNLPLHYAPNGVSWMRLTEAVPFVVQVEKIETNVF